MGPIDYTIDVASPMQSAVQGFAAGSGIKQAMDAQIEARRQRQAQEAMQLDLSVLAKNPTPQAIASMSLKYPQMSEQFKRSFDMLDSVQKQNRIASASQVYAAVQSGRPDIAVKLLKEQADAMRNSGSEQEANAAEAMASWAEQHPDSFKTSAGLMLSAAMGPDKFADTFGKLGSERRADEAQPDALRKGKAEADEAGSKAWSAAVAAKYADSNAVKDLEKKGWDIKKIASDIEVQKANVRIAAMNAATARANSETDRARLNLQMQEAIQKRDDIVRSKAADVESARSTIDNFLNTADRFLSAASDKNTGRASDTLRAAAGPIDARMPTMQADVADLEALAETMSSQAFLSQIPAVKGTGSLSNEEGNKIQASLANLGLKQSPEQLLANVREAQRLMLKARKNISVRYGVPDTVPDTPAASATPAEIDALLRKYGAAP